MNMKKQILILENNQNKKFKNAKNLKHKIKNLKICIKKKEMNYKRL